jgi:energy-coupling factor transport system permease protein
VSYRRRPSPLHAARAAAGIGYCAALGIAALLLSSPLLLATITVAIAGAGMAAGVGPQIRRAAAFALPLAITIMMINALVSRDGLTVIVRLGNLPILGHTDVTLEATVYGAILGLRAVALILCGALYTAAVDPDEVLRLLRRFSLRSALTASLATRLVPMLVRDSRRLADAQRCRPGSPPSRMQLMRAATSAALDRALDVAAALETRGYGSAQRSASARRPYSRHDISFLAAAVVIVALAVVSRLPGTAPFQAYPALHGPIGASELLLSAALLAVALLPFADRRGVR